MIADLRFEKVEVDFIYSFLIGNPGKQNLQEKLKEIGDGFVMGIPDERKGFTPYFNVRKFNDNFFHRKKSCNNLFKIYSSKRKKENKTEIDLLAKINLITIINSGGGGTVTITVSLHHPQSEGLNKNFKIEDIMSVVNLASHFMNQKYNKEFQYLMSEVSNETEGKILYSLFIEEMEEFKSMKFRWIDEEILNCDRVGQECQSPLIFARGQLVKDQYEEIFEENLNDVEIKHIRQTQYSRIIIGLLTRFVDPQWAEGVSSDYIEKFYGGSMRLKNLNVHSHFFVNFSRLLTLGFCKEMNHWLSKNIIASILYSLELLRINWHCCIVSSIRLSNVLLSQKKQITSSNIKKILAEITGIRRNIAILIEDYSIYNDDGHIGSDIIELARKELNLDRLEKSVTDKIKLVENYFSDIMQQYLF